MNIPQIENGKDHGAATDQMKNIASTSGNPFDLSKLKFSQDFESMGGSVNKLLTTIPVRKPNKQAFIRAFSRQEFQLTTAIIELKGEQDGTYLVSPELREELLGEIHIVHLVTCVDRAGNIFLWPIKVAKAGERSNPWNDSALLALGHAEKRWIRVSPNMTAGHYDVFAAQANLPDPSKPDLTLQQIIEIAFRGRLIDSADHPVLKKLRGEE